MNHSFNTEIAKKYGIEEAIILENIYFWCKKNEANKKHIINGTAWTYNSVKAFNELFDYMNPSKISRALKNLELAGLIKSGIFNSNAYDRTKWYCVTEEAVKYFDPKDSESNNKPELKEPEKEDKKEENEKCNFQNDESICQNEKWSSQNNKMNITDINTDINTNEFDYDCAEKSARVSAIPYKKPEPIELHAFYLKHKLRTPPLEFWNCNEKHGWIDNEGKQIENWCGAYKVFDERNPDLRLKHDPGLVFNPADYKCMKNHTLSN